MKRTGILPDKFRLAKGKWTLTKKEGTKEEVESNGSKWIDMKEYRFVQAVAPKKEESK